MKSFLKYVLATLLGLIVFNVVLALILFAGVGIAVAGSDKETTLTEPSVFELKLSGTLVERSESSFNKVLSKAMFREQNSEISLEDILGAIKKAKSNDNIKGIYLRIGNFYASSASIEEIYAELKDFKQSGKFVVSYADDYGNGTYFLASIADKIYLNPIGSLSLTGISMQSVYFKDLLDKLGIQVQVFKVGTFKAAVEPFTQSQMSEANRLQLEAYTSSVWGKITETIADNRNISVADVMAFADQGSAFDSTQVAVEKHFVDKLIYEHEMEAILADLVGNEYETLSLNEVVNIKEQEIRSKNRIAIVYAYGEIEDGATEGINSCKLAKELHSIAENDKIKGVVLRVNSPGGSAFGSEQIWEAVRAVKEKKPVAVSMGDYAASGGYYISCNADRIFAQPTTLTGSIGIFGMFMNFGQVARKTGVKLETVKTNKYSDLFSIDRPMTSEEHALLQRTVECGYELFTQRCASGREISQDSIKKIAEGRIYSGIDALALGLVDEIGGIDEAIAFVAQKADISDYKLSYYPAPKDAWQEFMSEFTISVETRFLKSKLGENYSIFRDVTDLQKHSGLRATMPYRVSLK